jgi:poly-gamma-glutamate synthase PgsB/CapB
MNLTVRLGGKVFLWECMALTPAFVRILQRHWARDDISTITNTYPDHEDIQGPAGYDIPNVMTEFIPARSTLVSTEEQMRPILEQGARKVNTSMTSVDWLRIGLLAPEVLARFPYEEHPANIALVTVLAERMGVPEEVVLKEMADRVVPDIGVLKAFPWARVGNRFIEFVNGMSANERFAALGNWERMGFADQEMDGKTVLVTLVNNRADRVSRSRMFASILVRDLSADRHVLIGSNLKGLQGYMRESLDEWLESVSLDPERNQGRSAEETLVHFGQRLRVPITKEQVRAGLEPMLMTVLDREGVENVLQDWEDPDRLKAGLEKEGGPESAISEIMYHHARSLNAFGKYRELETRVRESGEAALPMLRKWMKEWFLGGIVTVDDVHADGEWIIHDILAAVPPGSRVRVMGMQNIKGPGLDFVYRWQGWETCRNSLNLLLSDEETLMDQGLAELMTFQDHGQLTREAVLETVAKVRSHPAAQTEKFQAGLNLIKSSMKQAVEEVDKGLESGGGGDDGLVSRVITMVEEFLDAGDGVRRRKTANRIYKDMAAERISTERAALELKRLNKRQKGGWLKEVLRVKV